MDVKETILIVTCFYTLLAVWHQYDDTIFSPPGKFQSFRNTIPIEYVKSMDTVKGRSIATSAMLDEINFTNWEVVEAVNDIAYCMTETLVEKGGDYERNVPSSYNFYTVSQSFKRCSCHIDQVTLLTRYVI